MSDELTLNVVYQYPRYSGIFLDTEKDTNIPISIEKIKRGLRLHFECKDNKNVNLSPGNIASIGEGPLCKYYTCRGTCRSPKPWYGISVTEKNNLKDKEIKKVVFLFWGEHKTGGKASFYSASINLDDIEKVGNKLKERYYFNFDWDEEKETYICEGNCNENNKDYIKMEERGTVKIPEAMGSYEDK